MLPQQPSAPVLNEAEAELNLAVAPDQASLEDERPRPYGYWLAMTITGLVALGIALQLYSGVLESEDELSAADQAAGASVPDMQTSRRPGPPVPPPHGDPPPPAPPRVYSPEGVIHIVIDRSGSMKSMGRALLDGVNEFISKLREIRNGRFEVSVTTFDSKIETAISNDPIKTVRYVAQAEVEPRDTGMRTLNNAIFKAIENVDRHPTNKRIIFIITGGEDNGSKKTRSEVSALIKAKRALESPYLIQYLGTNQDVVETGKKYGIDPNSSFTFSQKNVKSVIGYAARQAKSFLESPGEALSYGAFTEGERKGAMA